MPKRTDKNHSEIIAEFRKKGADVCDTHALPNFVDCVVGYRGLTALVEIKHGNAKLTKSQEELMQEFDGWIDVVRDSMDVERVMDRMLVMSSRMEVDPWE